MRRSLTPGLGRGAAAALIVLLGTPAPVRPADQESTEAFSERAREGTERYRDRAVAIAEGFRPLGPDAPAMGQHWIHASRVLSGTFDPARPAGLTYIVVDDRPELTGVFYVLPLEAGAHLPAEPIEVEAWHFHNGDLSDEALLSVHDPTRGSDDAGLRIAVLHAWIWAENPAGVFTPDNWSLPYVRLRLSVPSASPRAAMAASLATQEGRQFFALRMRQAAGSSVVDAERLLREHGERIRARLIHADGAEVSETGVQWLENAWNHVTRDLLEATGPANRTVLRRVLDPHAR